MLMPMLTESVKRAEFVSPQAGFGITAQCDAISCALAVYNCSKCGTDPSCYANCLGSLCSSCCDCIPGLNFCNLC